MSVSFILSCKNSNKPEKEISTSTAVASKLVDNINKPDKLVNDEFIQVYGMTDTIRFSRTKLNLAQKLIPQFIDEIVLNPDLTYGSRPKPSKTNSSEENDFLSFGCEVCQDDFMLIYTYFLKQRNLGKSAEIHRNNFIAIYRLINSIYRELSQGGTYFGHQHYRIYAYAEYSVYLRKYYEEENEKKYPVSPQKYFFIGSLKQLINEDEKYNMEVHENDKQSRKESLLKKINKLDHLITNHFYLEEAQKFNYLNY